MANTILEKGAIPRILQEIYYSSDDKGHVWINQRLTVMKFAQKLKKLQKREYTKIEDKAIDDYCDNISSNR